MTIFKLHSEPLKDEWLDAYGHLNEAYYLVPFTNTTWLLQDQFNIGVEYFEQTGCALYTVESHLRYVNEVRKPAEINVESIILGSDAKKIWFAHLMVVNEQICATAEFLILHYSTREGKTIVMPDEVQRSLKKAEIKEKPEWTGRQISLVKK